MRVAVRFAVSVLLVASCFLALQSADKPTTVILVRHAEKSSPTQSMGQASGDVDLSDAGKKRAECLANILADANVRAVISTEFKRTQQTAAPLAAKLSVTPIVIKGADMEGLLAEIQKHSGETILIAGHSNTVPAMVKRLGGGDYTIKDEEYDRMFIVTLANGSASTVALRYCQ
jgi:broad specificity phosphatase PhoE